MSTVCYKIVTIDNELVQGCAFLYVAREHQSTIRPLVVSWGFNHGYSAEFAWIGRYNMELIYNYLIDMNYLFLIPQEFVTTLLIYL